MIAPHIGKATREKHKTDGNEEACVDPEATENLKTEGLPSCAVG